MSKKIEYAIAQYMLEFLPESKCEWYSSAQKLENALCAKGVRLPQKLFYTYKLPGGANAPDYEIFLAGLRLAHFDVDVAKSELMWLNGGKFFDVYSNLSDTEKQTFFDSLTKKSQEQKKLITQECLVLRKLNPELANLDVPNNVDLLYGATYGFAPDEIMHYHNINEVRLDYKQNNKELERQHQLRQQLDVPVTYRLSPKTIDMIMVAAQNIEK